MKKKIGIFGGSFNPVHSGHMMLASWIAQCGVVDSVWLMLSPRNPLKPDCEMASDSDRLRMLELAADKSETVSISTLELELPRPSYTINTLKELDRRYPQYRFVPIVGSDNLAIFNKWRCADEILERYGLIVYPRPGYDIPDKLPDRVEVVDAPRIEISSTKIRRFISDGWNMNFFLPPGVYRYIKEQNLYKKQHGTDSDKQ